MHSSNIIQNMITNTTYLGETSINPNYNNNTIALLQIILSFFGFGGIGNLVANRLIGLLQLVLTSQFFISSAIVCRLAYGEEIFNNISDGVFIFCLELWFYTICCCGLCRFYDKIKIKPCYFVTIIILYMFALIGFIWSLCDGFLILNGNIVI
jgi:hypothetical protein